MNRPSNGYIGPLLTDFYQLTMAYAYFQGGKHDDHAVFDLFIRKSPFGGEFTVFAGLSEVLHLFENFKFSDEDLQYICKVLPKCSEEFKSWLRGLDCSRIKLYAVREGNVVFPRVPLIRVEGPLGICQLIETPLLNLINYPSLVATNAARMKIAAGPGKKLIEFGLRRAPGPDGAVSASHYSYLGGFEGTSNLMAGRLFDIPVGGTQAHSFISSFSGLKDLHDGTILDPQGTEHDFIGATLKYRTELGHPGTNEGELASFVAYAQAFPDGFLALVDTYDTLHSGLPNFLAVALALANIGYKPIGIRLDSGDLSHLSIAAREMFAEVSDAYQVDFRKLTIIASNEINEVTLRSLNQQGHEIDTFGIGTHLVTNQSQPSLGGVYKLVEINGRPKIKLAEEPVKVTIPARKQAYRLFGKEGFPLLDLMMRDNEPPPKEGERFLCCHPFVNSKRTFVTPRKVAQLHHCVWDGRVLDPPRPLRELRQYAADQLASLRPDHLRMVNPTPYKVSLSKNLYDYMHQLWTDETPVGELE